MRQAGPVLESNSKEDWINKVMAKQKLGHENYLVKKSFCWKNLIKYKFLVKNFVEKNEFCEEKKVW